MRSFVSSFQPTKSDPLFWVKNPFSWKSNRNHGIFRLTFVQVAKSVQISLFLSNKKPQVNGVHKNQPPLHIPTKRIFYHLRPKRSTKPQLALILSYFSPLKRFSQENFKAQPWDLKVRPWDLKARAWDLETPPCRFNKIYICTGEHICFTRKVFQKKKEISSNSRKYITGYGYCYHN